MIATSETVDGDIEIRAAQASCAFGGKKAVILNKNLRLETRGSLSGMCTLSLALLVGILDVT